MRPAQPGREPHAEHGGAGDLGDGARDGDLADGKQILEREMQANAEHQEDDADLGELAGEILVGDIARRERADDDAGQQIADQRAEA